MHATQLFKLLSDPTRLRCLSLLVTMDELCVCELTHALALPQPKISHHLGTLRKAELVCDRKEGLWIFYRINPELSEWIIDLLKMTVNSINNEAPFANDAVTLSGMPNRPGSICNT